MTSGEPVTGESTESFEEAAREAANKLKEPHTADQLIEFELILRYKEGGFVGYPPTYIAEVPGSTGDG